MPHDQLRDALETVRSRIQAELESQLQAIATQHEDALAEVRQAAETDAEQRWASKIEAVRAEWTSRLESEVTAARGEAERRMVAESMRFRVEAEQAAAESTARVREELEQALATERQRTHAQIEAERQQAERDLEAERQRMHAIGEAAQQAQSDLTDARIAERQAQLASIERLLASVRAISGAPSLSAMLDSVVTAAAAEAPRAALFIADGGDLQMFSERGFHGVLPRSHRVPADGILGDAVRSGESVSADMGRGAPAFASLPADRAAVAVPITVGERSVAILYADDAGPTSPEVPAAWPEAIEILGRHAAACLAYLTAVRTAQALALDPAGRTGTREASGATPRTGNGTDDENGARRYARLLVSEIKLYNETAVRLGREKRDLLNRLRPEIERARRLYEERVPSGVGGRAAYFQQELVQTLADGDPALLGI